VKRKVLIADDSLVVRRQLVDYLVSRGVEPLEAADGKECLDQIESHADIALVICDINMPVMSGIEVAKILSTTDRKVHVVMLTAESSQKVLELAKSFGVRGFIRKPFKAEVMDKLLEAIGIKTKIKT